MSDRKNGIPVQTGIRAVLAAAVLLLCLLAASAAAAEDWMAEARRMLTMINDFRTGGNAWCWNASNTGKKVETRLSPLVYDLELEQVAKTRAEELAISMSHTRPDGSSCFSAYPAGNYAKAENIACGYRSVEAVFEAFLEENEPYERQGHRRNMLRRILTRVGFAAVEVNGTVYWAQEFASGAVRSPLDGGGWNQEDGVYYYVQKDGSRAVGWLQDQNKWYYMDSSGAMQTGWQKIGGRWYYFDSNGEMQTGWQKSSGQWYYFDSSGAMQTGWQKSNGKWYYFAGSGVMQTGWQKDGNEWYYLDDGGEMQDEWQKIDGKWYYLGLDGTMRKGWQKIDGSWYYFASSGAMQTGWKQLGENWYYFRPSGEMVKGSETIQGQTEIFDSNGVWQYSEIEEYATPLGIFTRRSILERILLVLGRLF